MAWRDTLLGLQTELAEVRAERMHQAKEEAVERDAQRQQLSQMAASLEMARLVEEMNTILLKGGGNVESYSSWENPEEYEGPDDELLLLEDSEDADADYLSAVLTWEEDGEREIAVDLGISEEGLYLQVNGVDVRLERNALEQALVEAFREELQL